MAPLSRPWQTIRWKKTLRTAGVAGAPAAATQTSLRTAIRDLGSPYVPGKSALEEAHIFLSAGAEIEHALLVEYLYAVWSLGSTSIAGRVLEIAVQEMCHFVTVQNLLLFAGGSPFLSRQDQDPDPTLDPFPFALRPFTKAALEDYLLAEMPPINELSDSQRKVMQEIIDRHGAPSESVHPVGLIYAHLYWLFQENDQPTPRWPAVAGAGLPPGRHIESFPGQNTAATFQVDPGLEPHWNAQHDHGGVFQTIDSRESALNAIAAIVTQGEGLASEPTVQSHFETFLDIYTNTDLSQLPLPKVPTDPFVASQAAADPAREANRITHKLAAALCGVFDSRYRIMLTSIRAALSRDRSNAADSTVRDKYATWALQEMLGNIKGLARNIVRFPCKDGGTTAELAAAPTFTLGDFELPDEPAALDQRLLDLHHSAASAIADALSQNPDAGTKLTLQQIQGIDRNRLPDL